MRWFATTILIATIILSMRAQAEVKESSPNGFLVKSEIAVFASPDSAYRAVVRHIANWWDPAHTYSGDSRNLSIDARPGGCFCETLPRGGGVQHLEVIALLPGKLFRLSGGLGPLQEAGLAGSLTFSFMVNGDSTTIEVTYSVGGHYPGDLQKIAPGIDAVIRIQLDRLKNYIETGMP